ADWLERLPDRVWESAAAVGNPFSLGLPFPGETVVDVGCGAGADACVAATLTNGEGRVVGIDCTPAMVAKASRNAQAAGLSNLRFIEAEMSALPLPDACADMVISNGVINLSMDKPRVLAELFRILRPGGRLQIADMVRDPSCTAHACDTGGESWADCVSGTLEPVRFLELLSAAGFADAVMAGFTGYRTSPGTTGALFRGSRSG
ncbi:MAG: methyltransferase domain-containing protein, partial [Thiohalobacterales bacterium]|nr:methyltransferase domain-containing protein [Thiohalobacterales bacterium]